MDLEELMRLPPYGLEQSRKLPLLLDGLNALTRFHRDHCPAYGRLLDATRPGSGDAARLEDVPFVPVDLFKRRELKSVPDEEVYKILTSSGTTSAAVSRVFLDRATARRQTLALGAIMTHFLGPKRLPMIVVDSESVAGDRTRFNARAAGIVGLSTFGRDHFYALDERMELDRGGLRGWLTRHAGGPFLMFGFTFMVWKYFLRRVDGLGLDLSRGILLHSGGWKALQDEAVGREDFKRALREAAGLARVHDFYGMAEQVGSVFMECERGFFHSPNFAEVAVRDPETWDELGPGRSGVLQVLSLLPGSYPGHSLLTEDLGRLAGVDDCACGRRGRYFLVDGRVPKAEPRGCSDVHASAGAA